MRCAWLRTSWQFIRRLSGDDAYEQYLRRRTERGACCGHQEAVDEATSAPLSRSEFYRRRQAEQWNSIKRCC